MKLTVLGNNGPFAALGGACSSYLVEQNGEYLLLDFGNGALANLQRHIPIEQIGAVVLSHLHHDHISDFFVFCYAWAQLVRRGVCAHKPRLFLPASPPEIAKLAADPSLFDVCWLEDGMCAQAAGCLLQFARMSHPVETYAVAVRAEDRVLVYTGDTVLTSAVRALAHTADLFLADAGLLERDKTPQAPHMTVREACTAGAKRTLLTHLSPFYTKEEILQEVQGNALLAELDETYHV